MMSTLNLTEESATPASSPSTVRVCELVLSEGESGQFGLSLSRSKWDPYPWIAAIATDSDADRAGVRVGDCVLEVNGDDVLGMRIADVAAKLNKATRDSTHVSLVVWNPGLDPDCNAQTLCCGPMPTNLRRLTSFLSHILSALECPVCLDTISPPAHQCANGHLICLTCRVRTERCPVCRLQFFRGRSLLADQVFNSLIDAFELNHIDAGQRSKLLLETVYGKDGVTKRKKPKNKFLTRIMGSGKSSSVENLNSNLLLISESKVKSLSSSELSFAPASRSASVRSLRSGRSVSSCHGSAGDLTERMKEFSLKAGIDASCQTDSAWYPPGTLS